MFILSTLFSSLESLWFVQMVKCGTIIQLSVHEQLTTWKTFTCTQSSSPIAQCAKHRNRHVEMGIHHCASWENIGYTSNCWYSQLWEKRQRDGIQHTTCKIEQLEPQRASSGICNVSLWRLISYPIFFISSFLVWLSGWWTGYRPSVNNIPESTNSASAVQWCVHILASLDSTSHVGRWRNGVARRWMHWSLWWFQLLWQLF